MSPFSCLRPNFGSAKMTVKMSRDFAALVVDPAQTKSESPPPLNSHCSAWDNLLYQYLTVIKRHYIVSVAVKDSDYPPELYSYCLQPYLKHSGKIFLT